MNILLENLSVQDEQLLSLKMTNNPHISMFVFAEPNSSIDESVTSSFL